MIAYNTAISQSGGTVVCFLLHQSSVLFCFSFFFAPYRFSQTQPQSGRQGDQALASVSGARTSLQRSLQHAERKARSARHQGQVQGPDRGGGGEGLRLRRTRFHPLRTQTDVFVALVNSCRRASATHTSGKGAWKTPWRFVSV